MLNYSSPSLTYKIGVHYTNGRNPNWKVAIAKYVCV